jgi:hypothetical protein
MSVEKRVEVYPHSAEYRRARKKQCPFSKTENRLMIKSIHRRSPPAVLPSSNPFPITTMNTAAFIFSRHNRTTLASFWLGALLFLLATSHLQAQSTPFDDLPVVVVRLLGSNQISIENGTFFADGHYVSGNNPVTAPRDTLNWSQAQLAAANGKPLFFADAFADGSGLYSKFTHSTEIYNWVGGTPLYIISAAGGSAAPVITAQPASQTVNAGINVTITVAATGTAPLTYQWRKGGVNVTGATSASLTLSNVKTNQAGNYAAVITNAYGSVTSSVAVLTVNAVSPGTVVAWGAASGPDNFGQTVVPAAL